MYVYVDNEYFMKQPRDQNICKTRLRQPEALSSLYTLRPEPPKSTTQYQLGMILYRVPARCPPAPSSLTVIGPSSTLIDGLVCTTYMNPAVRFAATLASNSALALAASALRSFAAARRTALASAATTASASAFLLSSSSSLAVTES